MEDHEIVSLFLARSEQAIAQLSLKYGSLCRKIAFDLLQDPDDAEECVNDVWLAVWNTVPPQTPSPLASYVCRITRNIAIKRYRANTAAKRNLHRQLALEELTTDLAASQTVEDELSALELTALLNHFLETLDADSRKLFVRRYWFGDSVAEIAERFGKTAHYISVRLSRTRKKLKLYLEQEGITL